MKKQFFGKKILSILMVIIMISMVGCGSASDDAATAKKTEAQQEVRDGEEVVATEERVTITMQSSGFEKTFAAGRQEDPVMKAIEDKLNINIEITPENSIADVQAKLSAQMASRDLPDIVYVQDDEIKKQMVSSKLALDLTPYMDQLSNVEENRPGSFDYFTSKYSVDIDNVPVDGLYFIGLGGTQGNLYRPKVGFYVRWDLYAELGYPEIATYDDYIQLAQDMLALEPVNADGKVNYGISGWFGQGGAFGPWAIHSQFNWDQGVLTNPAKNTEIDYESNELNASLTNTDSAFWTGVEFWNKAYRAGIVDPNAFVQKWPEYLENIDGQNRVMITWADFAILGGEAAFVEAGQPEKGYVALSSPRTDRSVTMMANYFAAGNRHYMVSAESEHPEKAVELLNFLASWEGTMMIYNGVQGQTWDVVDGQVVIFDETIKGLTEDPDFVLKTGMNKYNNLGGMGEVDTWPEYNVPAKLGYLPEVLKTKLTVVEAAACDYYGVDYPGQILTADKDEVILGKDQQYINYMALPSEEGEVGEKMKEISAQLQSMWFTDYYEAILADTEEEFTQLQADLIEKATKIGAVELYEYELARYKSAK